MSGRCCSWRKCGGTVLLLSRWETAAPQRARFWCLEPDPIPVTQLGKAWATRAHKAPAQGCPSASPQAWNKAVFRNHQRGLKRKQKGRGNGGKREERKVKKKRGRKKGGKGKNIKTLNTFFASSLMGTGSFGDHTCCPQLLILGPQSLSQAMLLMHSVTSHSCKGNQRKSERELGERNPSDSMELGWLCKPLTH